MTEDLLQSSTRTEDMHQRKSSDMTEDYYNLLPGQKICTNLPSRQKIISTANGRILFGCHVVMECSGLILRDW